MKQRDCTQLFICIIILRFYKSNLLTSVEVRTVFVWCCCFVFFKRLDGNKCFDLFINGWFIYWHSRVQHLMTRWIHAVFWLLCLLIREAWKINNTLKALRAHQSVHFNGYAKWDIWQTFNYLPSSRTLWWATMKNIRWVFKTRQYICCICVWVQTHCCIGTYSARMQLYISRQNSAGGGGESEDIWRSGKHFKNMGALYWLLKLFCASKASKAST